MKNQLSIGLLFKIFTILLLIVFLSGCGGTKSTLIINNPKITKTDNPLIPKNTSEPFIGHKDLDSKTEKFLYGTWKVEKLLGFANSWNDASEYPTGQKIIGDEFIIQKDLFSSKGLENYNPYQYELKEPSYYIYTICYNGDSFYSLWKIDLSIIALNDEVKVIQVSPSPETITLPLSFIDVNNNTLILLLEATCFELKRVTD